MKVLILSVTTGEGHNSSARALAEEVRSAGNECVTADAFAVCNRAVYRAVDGVYRLCTGPWRHAYGAGYRLAERRIGKKSRIANAFYRAMARRLAALLARETPDAVIYTHVYAGQLLAALQRQGKFSLPAIGVVTDFTLHPHWERLVSLGDLVVPDRELITVAISRGFPEERVHALGIPVAKAFSLPLPQTEARRTLGTEEDLPVVLIMGGSMGKGASPDLVLRIDRSPLSFRIVVICGRDVSKYRKLSALTAIHPLTVLGFTDRVNDWMAASNVMIGKPGGLSVSEALCRRLPLLLCDAIPGQETRNADFLRRSGPARELCDFEDPAAAVTAVLSDPAVFDPMQNAAESLRKPDAASRIAALAKERAEQAKSK